MRIAEMSTLRTILEKTRIERVKNPVVREESKISDIAKFRKKRSK